jgi:hypothetical protein
MEQMSPSPRTDHEMELLLDHLVEEEGGGLVEGFAARVHAARPFAPWETRHRRHWKTPAIVLGLLAGSSVALGMAPLFRLGPETALDVWAHLLAVSLVRPVMAAVDALPLVARTVSKAAGMTPGSLGIVGTAAIAALVPLLLSLLPILRRRRAGNVVGR